MIPALMALVFVAWVFFFAHQWRHRRDPRPATEAVLVEIEMILGAAVMLAAELILLLVAVL